MRELRSPGSVRGVRSNAHSYRDCGQVRTGMVAGHDPYRTAAVDAGNHVDAKHALEALRPSHRAAAFVWWAVVVVRVDVGRGCIDGSPSAARNGVTCE